jgi:hypothetical protein
MTRRSRSALVALAITASLVGVLAIGAPASAADVNVQSVTIDPTLETFVNQTITADVRSTESVVQIPAPLAGFVFSVQSVGLAGALAGDCNKGGPGVWICLGDIEAVTGYITITYLFQFQRTPPPPGTYTVSVSMGDNGLPYTGSGTVTIVGPVPSSGPANPPSSAAAAPTSPPSDAQPPAGGGAPPATGIDSPPSQAPSVGPTDVAAGPTTATATSGPTQWNGGPMITSLAPTVTTQRSGQSGPLTNVAVIAGAVVAAGAAAGLFIRRGRRRDRRLPGL